MRRRKSNPCAALTLVEVMIAMAVMGFTMFSALSGLLFSYRMAESNLRSLIALSTGRSITEQLMGLDYNSLLGPTLPADVPSSSVGSLDVDVWNARLADYRNTPDNTSDDLRIELNPHITRVVDSNGLDYVQVVVGVRWDDSTFFGTRVREEAISVILAPISSY
jgi:type II secretory pathway pseudopilin PulG